MDKQKDFEKGWEEIKEYCGDCEAWSGTDCTRNSITKDCLKERKQKQIEEMAEIALKNTMTYICAKQIALNFYEAGYRKIPENAVVLTREDREEFNELYRSALQRAEKWEKLCGIKIKETRKETAEKFAERVKSKKKYITSKSYNTCEVVFIKDIDEICKEITEGVKGVSR